MILYKYTSIEKFHQIVDIILFERLYSATLEQLNDPFEGYFIHQVGRTANIENKTIDTQDDEYRICSLTINKDNNLMWSHYANMHQGVVLEVKVNDVYKVHDMKYSGYRNMYASEKLSEDEMIDILTHKEEHWRYEDEKRVIIKNKKYINIKLLKIYLGAKVDENKKELLKELVQKLGKEIEVQEYQPMTKIRTTY
jgi:hypothetical protein